MSTNAVRARAPVPCCCSGRPRTLGTRDRKARCPGPRTTCSGRCSCPLSAACMRSAAAAARRRSVPGSVSTAPCAQTRADERRHGSDAASVTLALRCSRSCLHGEMPPARARLVLSPSPCKDPPRPPRKDAWEHWQAVSLPTALGPSQGEHYEVRNARNLPETNRQFSPTILVDLGL